MLVHRVQRVHTPNMPNATNTNAAATPAQIDAAQVAAVKHNPHMTQIQWGIEIETFHPSVRDYAMIARRMAEVLGAGWRVVTRGAGTGGYYRKVKLVSPVNRPDGSERAWTLMSDSSIQGGYGCEIVSPINTWTDLPEMQAIVRAARKAGLKTNKSCGIHIHLDGAPFKANPRKLVNLIKLVDKREDLIHDMIGGTRRGSQWARNMNSGFADRIKNGRFTTEAALRNAWYAANSGSRYGSSSVSSRVREHYDGSRYHGLNLHSLFYRGTVEFRYFDTANLHAGRIRAYVCLVLALGGKALAVRSIGKSSARAGVRGAYQVVYHELGLREDYFANVRDHLLKPIRNAGTATATRAHAARAPRTRNAAEAPAA